MASGNNKERADTRAKPEIILSYESALKLANEAEAAYLAGRTTADVDELKAHWKNAAQELFASACNLKVGFRKNTDTARNEARVQDARERLVRVETGAPLMGSTDVEIVEPEPVETDSGTVAPGPKENKLWESWGARAKSISRGIKNVKLDRAAEFLVGAGIGAGLRLGARAAFNSAGGWVGAAIAGGAAGVGMALWKERNLDNKKYSAFVDELLDGEDSKTFTLDQWYAKYNELKRQLEATTDKKTKKELKDKIRFAIDFFKEDARSGRISLEDYVTSVFGPSEESEEDEEYVLTEEQEEERATLLKEIKAAGLKRAKEVALVAVKGFALGALGAVVGAEVVELASGGLGSLYEHTKGFFTSFTENPPAFNINAETVHAAGEPATDLETFASEPDLNTPVPIPEVTQIPLDAGSNPWSSVEAMLEDRGIQPTNAQMLELMKVVSTESGISVPEWGISGESFVDHQQLPEGFQLEINADAERLISQMAQARSQ